MKQLAIWDYPPAEVLVFGFTSGAVPSPFTLRRGEPLACVQALERGEADVALVPLLHVLRDPEAYEVVPDVGIVSTESYPYVRLFLREGLGKVERLVFDPRYAQEILLTRIILQEHYQLTPQFVPVMHSSLEELRRGEADAVLLVGPDVPMIESEFLALDIGQEWFELTAYPMVWGVVASPEGRLEVEEAALIREAARVGAANIEAYVQAMEPPVPVRTFLLEHFSPLLEGPAEGGLDEFRQYLFYYGALEEVPEVPFIFIPEEEEEEEEKDKNDG